MLTIAVDGPVGAGKSSVSDAVAEHLNMLHLDTGAMYRAVGLAVLKSGLDPKDEEAVCNLCIKGLAHVDVIHVRGKQVTLLNNADVSLEIRTQEVGMAASLVSRYDIVRQMLVKRQREIAKEQPMLLDGRDIGTVVLPDASVKIYLTATPESRAMRRYKQLAEKSAYTPYEQVLEELIKRDSQDLTRKCDPLKRADDAVLVDSTDLDFNQTVNVILKIVEARCANKA